MITPPLTAYPVLPAHGADAAYYGRFLAALNEDVAALKALEEMLRVYDLHAWRDETGDIWHVLARPTVVGSPCDWPWRLKRVGANLELCGGAQALGHGEYSGLNEIPPFALPGQVYGVTDPVPDSAAVATTGAVSIWLKWLHSFISVQGSPQLSMVSTEVGADVAMPADTDTEMSLPLAFRLSGAEATLFTVAVGALELRHTPEPIPMDFDGALPVAPSPAPEPDTGSEGGGSDGGALMGASGSSGSDGSSGGGGLGSSSGSGGGSVSSSGGSDSSSGGSSTGSSGSSSVSPSYSSSYSSSSAQSSSSSSKIILPVNVDGRLEFVGWCASEAPNQQVEGLLRIETTRDGTGSMAVPAWMRPLIHKSRPDWRIVSAFSEDGYMVSAQLVRDHPRRVKVQAIDEAGRPACTTVRVRVRAATKTSREIWEHEPDPARRAASTKFHASTRRHDRS